MPSSPLYPTTTGTTALGADADATQRIASFGKALDALRAEIEASLGTRDVAHIRRARSISRRMELTGRTLIAVSFEPLSFSAGVAALAVHKTLELMEIGHTALHGCYDKLPDAEDFRAETFHWKAPIDEQSWRHSHNVLHHQYTNVQGRDPDLDFGGLRLSARVPRHPLHRLQPVTNFMSWLGFASAINLHATGMLDVYLPASGRRVLKDGGLGAFKTAHRRFLRKAVPYYARELVLFPALSGPFFLKTLAGNVLSEMLRDVFAGAVIYCGHVGATDHPSDARAGSRAAFYVMQAEAAYNIDVPPLISFLCGGLDLQIEHHLFPRVPPNRLREIAPRVRAICEQHGVRYRSKRWPARLKEVVTTLAQLGRDEGPRERAERRASAARRRAEHEARATSPADRAVFPA